MGVYEDEIMGGANAVDTAIRAGAALSERVISFDGGPRIVVVPDGYKVRSLEALESEPTAKRGHANLHDVASFVAYVNAHKGAGTAIGWTVGASAVAAGHPTVLAVLDGHASDGPGWGRYTASLVFEFSRQFKAWNGISGKAMTQAEIAEFVEELIADIAQPSGGALFEMVRAFTVSRNIQYSAAMNLNSGTVDLVYRDADAAAAQPSTVRVPEVFTLAIPVFAGDERVAVEVRFRYRLQDAGKLSITFKLTQIEDVIEAAVAARVEAIAKGTGITPLRGTLPKAIAPVALSGGTSGDGQ